MRVIAGRWRGRTLRPPAGSGTRPTTDRVREAVFDILVSMDAVHGARALDLFAGSGAMGIEALSRGAAQATFVDSSPAAVAAIEANLAATAWSGGVAGAPGAPRSARARAVGEVVVVRADVLRWLGQGSSPGGPEPGGSEPGGSGPGGSELFDLAFCDPPYGYRNWRVLLGRLPARLAVIESAAAIELGSGWDALKARRYGTTLVTLVRRHLDGDSEQ